MLRNTMQDVPLLLSRILTHGSTIHGTSVVSTWTGEGEPRRRTFTAIGRRAAQLAHALGELGVAQGEPVGTLMWNNNEHTEAYFAIPSRGSVLHTLNLRLPAEQLEYIVNHAQDRVILVNGSLLPLLAPLLPRLGTVEHVVVVGEGDLAVLDGCRAAVHDYETLIAGQPQTYDWPCLDERHPAAMCYTSGTTGEPKGVVYSHRSIYLHSMHLNTSEAFQLMPGDTTMPIVPMFHANAWGVPHAAFMSGMNMLMTDRFLQPRAIAEMIEQERPTHASAVPTIFQGLLAELGERRRDISSLRKVIIGGAACPPSLMAGFEKDHGVTVVHAWGMTEMSPLGTVSHPPAGLSADEAWKYRVTQGRFPANVEARLIGPSGETVPWDGAGSGELEVRGPWVAGAYFGGAGEEPVVPEDKFHDGWLRTGDIGTISPDGYLTLTDRSKDVIKSGGEWISSMELENHIMDHPAVAEAAVVAVPDERWGERPLATVVLRPGADVTYGQLRDFLAERVARWQLPERWTLLEAVPKTSVGKFDKKVIRRQYADGELDVTRL